MPGIGIGISPVFGNGGGIDWVSYFSTRAPTDLLVTIDSDTQVTLNWVNNGTADYTGHKVYISTDNINFTLNKTVASIGTTTAVTGLTQGTPYYFYIKAYNGTNESDASNTDHGTTFLTETGSYVARITTAPETGLKGLLNLTINTLKTANLWASIDYIVFYNLHTQQASLLNIKSTSYNHTIGATVVAWATKQGFTPDAIAGYINSNCKTGDGVAVRDDNFYGMWVRTSDGKGKSFGGSLGAGGTPRLYLAGHTTGDTIIDVWNNSAAANYSYVSGISDLTGLFISQRTANNVDEIWYNGIKQSVTGGNIASAGLTGVNDYIGCCNNNGTPIVFNGKQFAIAVKGKSLGTSQLALYNALKYFNDSIINAFAKADYFVSIGSDFAIGELNKSTAQYYNGKTYIVFQGTDDDPYIVTYKHSEKLWSVPVKVATNPLVNGDGHGEPALLIDDQGYIHVFFGCHYGPMKYSKSNASEDISAWTAQTDPVTGAAPNAGASYPHAYQVADNNFYLFYRGATTEGWRYKKSTDRGANWSAATDYVLDGNNYYAKITYKNGRFHLTYMDFPNTAGTGIDKYDVFYAYMSPTDEVWHNIEGDVLTPPLDKTSDCKVYDSGTRYIQEITCDVDEDNIPYLAFTEGDDETGTYDIRVIHWGGSAWVDSGIIITTENWRNYASAIDVRSKTKIQIYPVISAGGISGDIEKWESNDSGVTWSKISTILSGDFLDPVKVYNCIANERIVVFSYKALGTWGNDGYLFDDNGFV